MSRNELTELIETMEEEIEEMEKKVEALEMIQEKIDEIINKILSRLISEGETYSCSEFMKLLDKFFESIENETEDWKDMITTIENIQIGSCSMEDKESLENLKEISEAHSQNIQEEIEIMVEKIEELENLLAAMPTPTPALSSKSIPSTSSETSSSTSHIMTTKFISQAGRLFGKTIKHDISTQN